MKPLTTVPTAEDIKTSHQAIQAYIHRTPILQSQSLNEMTGADIYFKCENFQKIGAFKMRGGATAALRLSAEDRARGLATHSSGNHAQAVARSAQSLDVPAYIVMPHDAPSVKVAAVRGYGAEITFCENTPKNRAATLDQVVARTGASFIHPFDNYDVIAGQATAALELFEDLKVELDYLMAPVGGGGLLSGSALSAHYFSPNTKVIGAEPIAVDDAYRSMQTGKVEINETNITIADGLRTHVSEKTLGIFLDHVEEILLVDEDEIVHAMRTIWERMKIIIEPSCAVPFAALCRYPERFQAKKVGIILTGGNVDVEKLPF